MSPLLFEFYENGEASEVWLGNAIAWLKDLLTYGKCDRILPQTQQTRSHSPKNRQNAIALIHK